MRILCLCLGNTCRSPMLAALLKKQAAELGLTEIIIESAGHNPSKTGEPAAPQWKELEGETGIDLSKHRSRSLAQVENIETIDLVVSVDGASATAAHVWLRDAGSESPVIMVGGAQGGIDNPWVLKTLDAYRRCYEQLKRAIEHGEAPLEIPTSV